jgi:putative membrane protein insertion efficiency factor
MMARMLIGVIRVYRLFFSPWLGSSCRFEPTCSIYALQALQRHGAGKGGYLMLARLGRCHPWCAGGLDSVPEAMSGAKFDLFTRLISPTIQKKSS